jgi:hypothetical protein
MMMIIRHCLPPGWFNFTYDLVVVSTLVLPVWKYTEYSKGSGRNIYGYSKCIICNKVIITNNNFKILLTILLMSWLAKLNICNNAAVVLAACSAKNSYLKNVLLQ